MSTAQTVALIALVWISPAIILCLIALNTPVTPPPPELSRLDRADTPHYRMAGGIVFYDPMPPEAQARIRANVLDHDARHPRKANR